MSNKTIHYEGKVGIGTTLPSESLEVNGNIKIGNKDQAICTNRGKLVFSNVTTDSNHAIYNNYHNLDGEGSWDGMKFNVYNGAKFRVGNAAGVVPTEVLDISSGKVVVTGEVTCTSMTETSDERLKTSINPIQNALQRTLSLRGVTFQWKDVGMGKETEIGCIAQEIEKVFPEVVATDKEGNKSVAYSKMVAPLIEAIKEQQQQIDALRREVELLK